MVEDKHGPGVALKFEARNSKALKSLKCGMRLQKLKTFKVTKVGRVLWT